MLCAISACVLVLLAGPFTLRAQTPATLRIYLARHGETDWNVQHRLQGSADIPLNDRGRQQAQQLKDILRGVRLDAFYASSLSRSRDTATVVAGDVPVQSLPGLREQSYGPFQGKSDTDPEFLRRSAIPDDALDGGESSNQLFERARSAIELIRQAHPSGSVLIVGHRFTNKMILRVLLGLSAQQAAGVEQANDEVYLVEIDPGAQPRLWKLVREGNLGDL